MLPLPYSFSVYEGDSVTESQWREVAALFSGAYGSYSLKAPCHAGEPIRLGWSYYQRNYATPAYRLALCRDKSRLVAEAVYVEVATSRGQVALVVQLVVDNSYRHQGIASTLLHAIWGFSDYAAWGIVSSNAFTIETLESATFRKSSPIRIQTESVWLQTEVLSRVPFLSAVSWRVTDTLSVVNTGFYTARNGACAAVSNVSSRLGSLQEGEEWLAFVFRDQTPDDFSVYCSLIETSSNFVRDAYRQMPQQDQGWASKTEMEVEVILSTLPHLDKESCIADFGAGTGCHVTVLKHRGYSNVMGIDFAVQSQGGLIADCRTWISPKKLDLILCLYDVIGSFSEDEDNEAIIRNIAANLKTGAYAVLSVSNWDFLNLASVQKVSFAEDMSDAVRKLFALLPSRIMQKSGEFFDTHSILVDEKRRIVCHKEQFSASDGRLPAEYIIRDRRFTSSEIKNWLSRNGLQVVSSKFVRAGFDVDYAVSTGKEILIFARKV